MEGKLRHKNSGGVLSMLNVTLVSYSFHFSAFPMCGPKTIKDSLNKAKVTKTY